ncbi:hypothetical protein IMSHALPRED_000701 [Imshaugia aleurites]|uniref:Uncharacterized protein n=1 Tax=Imshaugia aleurites TaxID=172621 RepID=A0A8H3IXT3_9LECA|nr:hypothetical protein IMSHALPRED_000701 [Imshaugia aleurites]
MGDLIENGGWLGVGYFNNADDHITYYPSLSEGLVNFKAEDTAILALTAEIKVLAQMKSLRRGHDTQGKLKKINIDQTYEVTKATKATRISWHLIAWRKSAARSRMRRPKPGIKS